MSVKDVVLIGDPRLRQITVPVDFTQDAWRPDARDLADTLSHLRQTHGFGRGLAAPQIGSPFRMIAFECDLGTFVAFNPVITWRSHSKQSILDDCFSLPGASVDVLRHESISFDYYSEAGEKNSMTELSFSNSELIQHEIDHLDGVLMTDIMIDHKVRKR